jgi:hypothetical protein
MVQVFGGGLNQFTADRTIDGFNNVSIYQTKPVYVDTPLLGPRIEQQHIGPTASHSGLHTTPVWNANISPILNNK